jgi:hypothetical protein
MGNITIGRRTEFFVFFVSLAFTTRRHPLFQKADELSHLAIGAAMEVRRLKGPGWWMVSCG